MRAAGLKAISTVVESTAILIKSKNPSNPKLVELIASRIRGVISKFVYLLPSWPSFNLVFPYLVIFLRVQPYIYDFLLFNPSPAAQKYVLCTYNIERSELEDACRITPGKRAPTINSLDEEGWVAVSAMVERKEIAVAMDRLTDVGACDILVLKIENSRTR